MVRNKSEFEKSLEKLAGFILCPAALVIMLLPVYFRYSFTQQETFFFLVLGAGGIGLGLFLITKR